MLDFICNSSSRLIIVCLLYRQVLHEINGSELLLGSKNKRAVTFSSDGPTTNCDGGELGSMVVLDYGMTSGGEHLDLVQDYSSFHRQSSVENSLAMDPYTKLDSLDVIPSSCSDTILTSGSSCDGNC